MTPNIYRGEDVSLTLYLKYADGTDIDLTTVNGYKIEVFQDGKLIQKFSQNAASGYTLVVETSAATGEIKLPIEGENTVDAVCGKPVYYDLKIEWTDTDYPDNVVMKDGGIVEFAIMQESRQRNVTTF